MSAISTPFSAPCAARAVSSVIDYEGLPATKNYYDTLGTVITPKAWQALRGPRRNAHRIPPNTPELIAERAAVIFAAKTATAKEEESARLSAGAWIWIARDDDNAAAAEAVAVAMSSCERTSFTSAPELAKAWNGGELFGPNSKSHAVDPYRDPPVLVIADVGASRMREETDALLELLGDRRRHKRATLFASTFTGKSVGRALGAAGGNPERIHELIKLISAGVREGRQS